MSRLYWVYVGIKKYDVISLQRPTTTISTTTNHGQRQQKWPPCTHMRPCAPRCHHCLMGEDPPRKCMYIFEGWGGVWPSNTPMLRWCIIAGTNERFGGHTLPHSPQNYDRLLGGLSPIHTTRCCGAWCLIWGIMGPFLPGPAMVVTVVVCVL